VVNSPTSKAQKILANSRKLQSDRSHYKGDVDDLRFTHVSIMEDDDIDVAEYERRD